MLNPTDITEDLANKMLTVRRTFNTPIEKVWKAWTDASILDKWWAPKPWRTVTKSMDFKDGGKWLYCMAGPNGEKHWSIVCFNMITPGKSFKATSQFCDDAGNVDSNFPTVHWDNRFTSTADGTLYEATLTFDKEADMETLIKMGFKGGFTMGLDNLDEVLLAW